MRFFKEFSEGLPNRGIQLRSGTRQEFRFPSFSKVLTTSATKLTTKFPEELKMKGGIFASFWKFFAAFVQ